MRTWFGYLAGTQEDGVSLLDGSVIRLGHDRARRDELEPLVRGLETPDLQQVAEPVTLA